MTAPRLQFVPCDRDSLSKPPPLSDVGYLRSCTRFNKVGETGFLIKIHARNEWHLLKQKVLAAKGVAQICDFFKKSQI